MQYAKVDINGAKLTAYCPENMEESHNGLRGFASLDDDACMLFQGVLGFTGVSTANMNFHIDVVFLDSDFKVLKIVADVRPNLALMMDVGCRYILEMNAGAAAEHGLSVGDFLEVDWGGLGVTT